MQQYSIGSKVKLKCEVELYDRCDDDNDPPKSYTIPGDVATIVSVHSCSLGPVFIVAVDEQDRCGRTFVDEFEFESLDDSFDLVRA